MENIYQTIIIMKIMKILCSEKKLGGGVLLTQIHELDLILSLSASQKN